MNFKKLARVLQLVVSALVVYLLGSFITSNWEEFSTIFQIGWRNFAFLIACIFGAVFSASARFANIYRAIGAKIGYLESFGLYMASGVINFILPAQSGSAVRAVYLKQRHGMPYSQAPSVILGGMVFTFFIGGAIMLIASMYFLIIGQPPPRLIWSAAAVFTFSILFLWVRIPRRLTARLGRMGNMLNLFFDGLELLRSKPREFVLCSLWQVAEFTCSGLAFWVAFNSLGAIAFTVMAGLNFAVFGSLLNTVFITPGNIGVLEAAIGYIAQIYNFTFIEGASATALVHGAGYLVYYLIAPIGWYFLYHRNRTSIPVGSGETDL